MKKVELKNSQVLRRALSIIEAGWCKESYAKDRYSKRRNLSFDDPKACRFCSIGAIGRAAGGAPWNHPATSILRECIAVPEVESLKPCDAVIEWNDNKRRKKSEVVAAFKCAVKRAVQAEKVIAVA